MTRIITRRQVLKTSVAGATATFLPTSGILSAAFNARRPNVVMINAEDMNDYGFYGKFPGIKTPYLRKFQEGAATFERTDRRHTDTLRNRSHPGVR